MVERFRTDLWGGCTPTTHVRRTLPTRRGSARDGLMTRCRDTTSGTRRPAASRQARDGRPRRLSSQGTGTHWNRSPVDLEQRRRKHAMCSRTDLGVSDNAVHPHRKMAPNRTSATSLVKRLRAMQVVVPLGRRRYWGRGCTADGTLCTYLELHTPERDWRPQPTLERRFWDGLWRNSVFERSMICAPQEADPVRRCTENAGRAGSYERVLAEAPNTPCRR